MPHDQLSANEPLLRNQEQQKTNQITLKIEIVDFFKIKHEEEFFERHFCKIKFWINDRSYTKVVRSLSEFWQLHKDLKAYFNNNDFPVLSTALPILDADELETLIAQHQTNKVLLLLTKYFTRLITEINFVNDNLLDFLEVNEPYRSQLIQAAQKNVSIIECSYSPNKGSMDLIPLTYTEIDIDAIKQLDIIRIKRFKFEAKVIGYYYSEEKEAFVYCFEIVLHDKNISVRQIKYTLWSFKIHIKRIEEELGFNLPALDDFIPSVLEESSQENIEFISFGMENYLKLIFANRDFYCSRLLEFLMLHPITLEHMELELNAESAPNDFESDTFMDIDTDEFEDF